jgi:hypothetical protein
MSNEPNGNFIFTANLDGDGKMVRIMALFISVSLTFEL